MEIFKIVQIQDHPRIYEREVLATDDAHFDWPQAQRDELLHQIQTLGSGVGISLDRDDLRRIYGDEMDSPISLDPKRMKNHTRDVIHGLFPRTETAPVRHHAEFRLAHDIAPNKLLRLQISAPPPYFSGEPVLTDYQLQATLDLGDQRQQTTARAGYVLDIEKIVFPPQIGSK
jgi:hypothetical protein